MVGWFTSPYTVLAHYGFTQTSLALGKMPRQPSGDASTPF